MTKEKFLETYGLTIEDTLPIIAKEGFFFEDFLKIYGRLVGQDLRNHTFPVKEDFSGNVYFDILALPGTQNVDTATFTQNIKGTGYFFIGMKGLVLAYMQANKKMFIPKLELLVFHDVVDENDRYHTGYKDIPVLTFDGSIKYSEEYVGMLPKRNIPYGILLGRKE